MDRPVLALATSEHDRSRAIVDGRVGVDGWRLTTVTLSPEEIFLRAFGEGAFGEGAFDVAELSLSSFVMQRSRGASPYVAIPAFVSRSFRHGAIYVRRGGGVTGPQDLRGRRVGVPEYQVTAGVWIRAMFAAQYQVATSSVQWITGGVDTPGRTEKVALDLPPHIRVHPAPAGRTLSQMLIDGEISALICPRAPAAYADGKGAIQRMFPDPRAASQDYFRGAGVFPIMHLVGVRAALAERYPELPAAVYRAYVEAKALAAAALADTTALATMLPWQLEELDRTRQIMGADYWPYGVAGNRHALEVFLEAHHHQGLSSRLVSVDELFHPSLLGS